MTMYSARAVTLVSLDTLIFHITYIVTYLLTYLLTTTTPTNAVKCYTAGGVGNSEAK